MHNRSQFALVDPVRVVLHDHSEHHLPMLVSRVAEIVDIECPLLVHNPLRVKEEPKVDQNLRKLALSVSKVLMRHIIHSFAGDILERVSGDPCKNHVDARSCH